MANKIFLIIYQEVKNYNKIDLEALELTFKNVVHPSSRRLGLKAWVH